MIGCGTTTFTDPDDYRVNVPGANVNLVLTGSGRFKARATWVELPRLRLIRIEENLPRIAFVALEPGPLFVAFPTRHESIWNGLEVRIGDIIWHRLGERSYLRASGPSCWGLISLAPEDLAKYGRAIAHKALSPPPAVAKILQPPPKLVMRLRRLHAQACRLAETKPHIIAHRQVARALEQDLVHVLVNCLTSNEAHRDAGARLRHATIMLRFEEILASRDSVQPTIPKLAVAVGVPERTLRMCCAEFLGMSPSQYAKLRRLNLVRSALRRADPATDSIAAIARQYGFSELGRFAAAYRTLFGESPSTTLRDFGSNIRAFAEFA